MHLPHQPHNRDKNKNLPSVGLVRHLFGVFCTSFYLWMQPHWLLPKSQLRFHNEETTKPIQRKVCQQTGEHNSLKSLFNQTEASACCNVPIYNYKRPQKHRGPTNYVGWRSTHFRPERGPWVSSHTLPRQSSDTGLCIQKPGKYATQNSSILKTT